MAASHSISHNSSAWQRLPGKPPGVCGATAEAGPRIGEEGPRCLRGSPPMPPSVEEAPMWPKGGLPTPFCCCAPLGVGGVGGARGVRSRREVGGDCPAWEGGEGGAVEGWCGMKGLGGEPGGAWMLLLPMGSGLKGSPGEEGECEEECPFWLLSGADMYGGWAWSAAEGRRASLYPLTPLPPFSEGA